MFLAAACSETRRPGGVTPQGTSKDATADAGPRADADDPNTDGGPGQDTGSPDSGSPDSGAQDQDAEVAPDAPSGPDAEVGLDAPGAFDAQPFADAQTFPDAQPAADAQTFPDAQVGVDAGPPSNASLALATARALPNGPAAVLVDGALVTFVRTTALGNDTPGFAVQAEQQGPALWIAVDPATLSPPPALGDRIRFSIDQVGSNTTTMRLASMISGYTRLASNVSLAPLVQDISNAGDVVSNLTSYELELVRSSATIAAGFRAAGSFFQSARVDTPGVVGDPNFEIRIPTLVSEQLGLGFGCTFTVQNPLWRFEVRPQLQAFAANELSNLSCPPARVVTASSPNPNRIIVSLDRTLLRSSVNANGSQFSISGGAVTVTGAQLVGTNVILTTSRQSPINYQVQVSGTVTDVRGAPVDANFRSASFLGSASVARVHINEVNANIAMGCDLVELRVQEGGSLDGWTLRSRDIVMATFTGLTVSTNQLVVVHGSGNNATCNPGLVSGGETVSPSQLPQFQQSTNFDGAFDWYSTQGGIVNTDTVLTLLDAAGNVVDAVLLTDDPTGPSANASEDAALLVANVGEWTAVGGTIPAGGFVDDAFCSHAVPGLNMTSANSGGLTLQRANNTDSNTRLDWVSTNSASWGAANPGQAPF